MKPKAGLISDATAENPAEARASSRSRPETKRGKTSMSKKILILSTSPRKGGNSDGLADAFAEGAAIPTAWPTPLPRARGRRAIRWKK